VPVVEERRAEGRASEGGTLVVGAGPCGLACALELTASGHPVVLLEQSGRAGGLAASNVDAAGFTWDRGGHVVFSHYGEFDRLLTSVMGDELEHHDRSSYVHVGDAWVPYPFQNNLHRLPAAQAVYALEGLITAQTAGGCEDHLGGSAQGEDFGTWMTRTFGEGVVELFMRPYNEKVWAHPASVMSARWIAERVSTVDWRQAVRSIVNRSDDVAWGPNNLFAFPRTGGTGEIYRRAAELLGDTVRYGAAVVGVDLGRRVMTVQDAHGAQEDVAFGRLVWTGALDVLVRTVTSSVPTEVLAAADDLVHNSVTIVGIGYESPLTDERSWLYFPDADVPFYRATNFAKYAPANVPGGRTDRYSSWMTEIASSAWRPIDERDLGARVDAALRRTGLVPADAAVASVHVDHIPYAYPVPTLGRDAALAVIQPWLMEHGVLSRGRFGSWRYEIGNMDHAVKMGVDAARFLVDGTPEEAWTR
jgi:protoporphyrinogen oxidase